MTKIKDILAMPVGQKTGGYELAITTAKKMTKVKSDWYQRVMFADGGDEILGNIKLHGNVRLIRNTPIRIIVGVRKMADVNNKDVPCLYVDQWADASPVMSEPMDMMTDAEEWYAARQEEIRGKCRYGVVCAILGEATDVQSMPEPSLLWKKFINNWVEFIMTGK